jgi:hypothetical protein
LSTDVVERFRATYRELRPTDEGARLEPDRLVVVGDKVVVTFRHGPASETVHVWTVERGRPNGLETFPDLDAALAGLELTTADMEALAAALATPR